MFQRSTKVNGMLFEYKLKIITWGIKKGDAIESVFRKFIKKKHTDCQICPIMFYSCKTEFGNNMTVLNSINVINVYFST